MKLEKVDRRPNSWVFFRLIFNDRFVDSEKNFVSPAGITCSCRNFRATIFETCLWSICDPGRKLGNGDVSSNSAFTVRKSMNEY